MPLVAVPVETGVQAESVVLRDFGAWMTSEQRRIYVLCQRMLQDPDDAGSATQDVFLKAYWALRRQDAAAIQDPARWLSRIAVNTCMDRLRSRKWRIWGRRPAPEDEAGMLARTPCPRPEAEAQVLAGEIGARLNAALNRLSARQRAVFTLRHYDEMSLEEIGNVLGLDVGTVKAHMFRAIGKLRVELKDLYGRSLVREKQS